MENVVLTKNGHNMFDVSSLIQKAIRRCDIEFACYAANEMIGRFRPYLWKRLLVVSAEDCFDLVSHHILYYKKLDYANRDSNDTRYIVKALALLLPARKNRDADYFACNLLNSKEPYDFPKTEMNLRTRHGYDLKTAVQLLKDYISSCNADIVGHLSNEIFCWYRKLFWHTLKSVAKSLGSESVKNEIVALEELDLTQNKKPEDCGVIYITKALVILLRVAKYHTDSIFTEISPIDNIDLSNYASHRRLPDYTYDCHTIIGKSKGLTFDDFIITEQNALKPFEQGLFDRCYWSRCKKYKKEGYGDNYNAPRMPSDIQANLDNGLFTTSLFDV